MNPTDDYTALAPPLCPELMQRHFDAECSFNAALARFQANVQPISSPSLCNVLQAAKAAFDDGFCYLIRQQGSSLEVALRHKDGAEEISHALQGDADPALLLASLLGIPVGSSSQDSEPDLGSTVTVSVGVADQTPAPVAAGQPDLIGPDSPVELPTAAPGLAVLTPEQHETALAMIKQMEPAARKAFQIAFRNAFDLDRNVTRITPHITQLRHLEFIDRFTVEAAGGIAA
jgi:hypothetical protein